MAQTGFTPLQIYSSSTAAAAPLAANLANSTLGSELAINITDGKLFYKDNANAIQVIGWKVVPATAGGTGQTSYAVGDLLYADTTTTLAKLADVATGNALISGGVGVAPSYGKIGLTTHVSGVLPVANGGTNASTAGIASFNNITGYTAAGATGTTSTNLVFSTSPSITTPTLVGDVSVSTGNVVFGTNNTGLKSTLAIICQSTNAGTDWAVYSAASSTNPAYFILGNGSVNGIATGASGASSAMYVNKDSGSTRSINAAGSINANGTDYAEYMTKCGDFVISKGDICGINGHGLLTNKFSEAITFVVKSTNPSYVGGDDWFIEQCPETPTLAKDATDDEKAEYEIALAIWQPKHADWKARMEESRQRVDRIAFSGQVPVNVMGAAPGQYIVPIEKNDGISGVAVNNPTFEQYQSAIGRVIAIEPDGRAKIIVKIA